MSLSAYDITSAPFTTRPVIQGRFGVVSSGHYLASEISLRILNAGGNAVDAGVAGVLALTVLKPQSCGIAGESPMLLWRPPAEAARDKLPNPLSINGQGTAPRAATVEWFRSQGIDMIPGDGLLATTVPATFDACIEALRVGGRLSIVDVLEPAVELAREGFAVYPSLREGIARDQHIYRERYPSTGSVCLDDGAVPKVGWWYRQPEWAATFQGVLGAAVRARSGGREAELRAARDHFYRGPIAARLAEFARTTPVLDATGRANRGLIDEDDFGNYRTRLEEPVTVDYRGLDVYKCDSWTQGPVFLQQLRLLEGFDLPALGHNSADYIHVLTEAAKLAYADRERYYGDPEFAEVPMRRLLSSEYAAQRRRLIDMGDASAELRPGGRRTRPGPDGRRRSGGHGQGHDAHRRDRRRGPDVRRDPVGRLAPVVADRARPRLPPWTAAPGLQPRPLAPERAQTRQTSAHHAHAVPRHARRPARDGLRHAGWRQPRPAHAPGVPEHRRVRDGPSGSVGRAPRSIPSTSRARSTRTQALPEAPGRGRAASGCDVADLRAARPRRGRRRRLGAGQVNVVRFHPDTGRIEGGASPRSMVAYAMGR